DFLVVEHQIVEHAHHRLHGGARRLFEDRHAGRAVEMRHLQHPARLLRKRRTAGRYSDQHRGNGARGPKFSVHAHVSPFVEAVKNPGQVTINKLPSSSRRRPGPTFATPRSFQAMATLYRLWKARAAARWTPVFTGVTRESAVAGSLTGSLAQLL